MRQSLGAGETGRGHYFRFSTSEIVKWYPRQVVGRSQSRELLKRKTCDDLARGSRKAISLVSLINAWDHLLKFAS